MIFVFKLFSTIQSFFFFLQCRAQKEDRTLKTALSHRYTVTDRCLHRAGEIDVSAIWLWNDSDLEHLCLSQHGALQRFIKMNTHTHTKKVESSGRQNGHRHPTLYFILVSILQDAKYIIIMLYSRWRPIHQSVNWCGWLYTRPGFTEKWSKAWEQKQMKSVYMRVVSVHLSDLRQGYLCKRKITRIIYYTHKKKKKISPYSHYLRWFQSTALSFNTHIHKAFNASGQASILHLEELANLHLCQKTQQDNW